jgi:hypothetical protein
MGDPECGHDADEDQAHDVVSVGTSHGPIMRLERPADRRIARAHCNSSFAMPSVKPRQ